MADSDRDRLAKLKAANRLADWECFQKELLPMLERKFAALPQ